METVRLDETRTRVEQISDGVGLVRFNDYWGQGRKVIPEPQAFLVHLEEPGALLKIHMHDVDQFQVAVRGNGRIGAHQWEPVSIQYADAFTAYGPIVRGNEGLSFHTIRMVAGGGNWKMPEARALMEGGRPGRNLTGKLDLSKPLPAAGEVDKEYVIDPHADGLAVAAIRLGADARTEGYDPAGGQYMLVCAGSLLSDGKTLPVESLVLLKRGEPAPSLQADGEGAVVLVLQFPLPTARKGSDPEMMGDRGETYASQSSTYTTPL